MAAPVVGDDAVALAEKIEHLRIPIVAAQRPPVVKDDRLGILKVFALDQKLGARNRRTPVIRNRPCPF
jgi:hypothetical protein